MKMFKGLIIGLPISLALWMLILWPLYARAQEVKATIDAHDIDALNQIITEQVPPRWSAPFANWVNGLVQRQAKIDADKKAAEAAKVEQKKDEPRP